MDTLQQVLHISIIMMVKLLNTESHRGINQPVLLN